MNETKVQEKNSDSNVADDSKIPRQENDNMEPLTLNGKTTFISVFSYISFNSEVVQDRTKYRLRNLKV